MLELLFFESKVFLLPAGAYSFTDKK